ncbi:MAG: hypothetical protein P8Y42_17130 [Exilibacterium sp.]
MWPQSLPRPLIAEYRVSGELPVIRTPMESGPDRVTRVSSSITRQVSVSLLVSHLQAATFWRFFETTANAGADWFSMPLDTAGGVAYHRVRFTRFPTQEYLNLTHYRIRCVLETDDSHTLWSQR